MKKRLLSLLMAALMIMSVTAQLIAPVVSLADDEGGRSACIEGADTPMAQFAADEIAAALAKKKISLLGSGAEWTIRFLPINKALGEQCYEIRVSDKLIEIAGGDTNGLMYGGLEVAEQIALMGFDSVQPSSGSPSILNRGIKFNAPLDMRTPSYSDAGEHAQLNIPDMWDMSFWTEYFDELARYRYNSFSLWNLNPFPSMVKVEDYPDVALDDVWRTTIPFDSSYNGTATNMVRAEHWENYEVVKEITIDEKIDFWREVMAYAHSRGIKFYVITWNIYTYGENGKYGITNDVDNETTIDYYRKSVAALVRLYPDLDGIGAAAGENMKWEPGTEEINENWLWATYGQGINDALSENPDRDFTFIHRLHLTDFSLMERIWSELSATLDFSDKYSVAHMHSSTHPTFADETLNVLPEEKRLWLEVRSDDMYYTRWGDPDYIRDYLGGMPKQGQLRGFFCGTDGYTIGRDYTSPDEYGILHIKKHWYEYALIGRLAYNTSLNNEFFKKLMEEHFSEVVSSEKADQLYEAMELAGKVVPQIVRLLWINGDMYFPEMNLTNVSGFGFLSVKYWANTSTSMPDAGVMSISDYVAAVQNRQTEFTLQTPAQAADELEKYASQALAVVGELLKDEPASCTDAEEEFYNMVKDQQMQATMGLYYVEKIRAALDIKTYNATSDTNWQESSIIHLQRGLELWNAYTDLFGQRYKGMLMGRLQLTVDPAVFIPDAEKDISIAEKWRVR